MLKLPHRSSRVSSTSGPLPCWHGQSHLQLTFVYQVFKGELHFGPLPCRQYLSISNSDQLASWSKHGEVFNPGLSLAFLNRRERLTAKAVVSRRLAKLTPFYNSTFLIIYFESFYKFSSFLQLKLHGQHGQRHVEPMTLASLLPNVIVRE